MKLNHKKKKSASIDPLNKSKNKSKDQIEGQVKNGLKTEVSSSIYSPEVDCTWNNLQMCAQGSDAVSALFNSEQLPTMQLAFKEGTSKVPSLRPIHPLSLDTQGRALRVYHVAYEAIHCEPFIFIRNETVLTVDNWASCLNMHQAPNPGDFVDYPARLGGTGWGGLRADLFLINEDILMSSSLGTHALSSCTSAHTKVYQFDKLNLYYIELEFAKNARYAFALSIDN